MRIYKSFFRFEKCRKACKYRLYRLMRTYKEIVKNYILILCTLSAILLPGFFFPSDSFCLKQLLHLISPLPIFSARLLSFAVCCFFSSGILKTRVPHSLPFRIHPSDENGYFSFICQMNFLVNVHSVPEHLLFRYLRM